MVNAVVSKQNGQAMTEFVVLASVLVPLVLMIAFLGKVADVNHTAVEAARYAAWERTVSSEADKSNVSLQGEVQRRFFERSGDFLSSGESVSGKPEDAKPEWQFDEDRVVRAANSNVRIDLARYRDPGKASAAVTKGARNLGRYISSYQFPLEQRGLVDAQVKVDIAANIAGMEPGTGCGGASQDTFTCLSRRNVLLTDTWMAGSPADVERGVKAFVPSARLEKAKVITDAISYAFPEVGGFTPGYVAPDVVPDDRLGPYVPQ